MKNSARNNLNKLIHVINEVRNTQLCWGRNTDLSLVEYRNKASKAIADELQAFVDRVEADKYAMNRFEVCNQLYDYRTIDVVNSAAFHAEVLITDVYNKIEEIADARTPLGQNHGLPTDEAWKAAADFVDFGKLAHDSIVRWNTSLHFAK